MLKAKSDGNKKFLQPVFLMAFMHLENRLITSGNRIPDYFVFKFLRNGFLTF